MTIMDKNLTQILLFSPIWFGSLAKALVFGHKLVTFQELPINALSHSKRIVILTGMENILRMLEMLDNVPMWKRK